MLSSTDEASSITGNAIPLPKSCNAPTSVEARPPATPAIASPNCKTMEIVTFREVTLAMRSPRATPHIVLAERARRRRNERRLPTERDTISAVSAGLPDDWEPSM